MRREFKYSILFQKEELGAQEFGSFFNLKEPLQFPSLGTNYKKRKKKKDLTLLHKNNHIIN